MSDSQDADRRAEEVLRRLDREFRRDMDQKMGVTIPTGPVVTPPPGSSGSVAVP